MDTVTLVCTQLYFVMTSLERVGELHPQPKGKSLMHEGFTLEVDNLIPFDGSSFLEALFTFFFF